MNGLKWAIGEVEIFQIVELEDDHLIQSIIPQSKPEKIKEITWLTPHFADTNGKLKALVQSFLIKSNGKNILIDTCNGNDRKRPNAPEWSNLQTNYMQKLKDIEVSEEEVDIVVCTHLHFDHVGWNTRLKSDKWVPNFPNARYLFAKKEYDYWIAKPEREIEDDHLGIADSIIPIVKAGLEELVTTDHRIDNQIRLISTPGHTPHHVSVMIESKGKKAIITGDFVHHPCQIAQPEWGTDVDTLPEKAKETRYRMLKELADKDILVIGSHFATPVSGKIVSKNSNYKLKV